MSSNWPPFSSFTLFGSSDEVILITERPGQVAGAGEEARLSVRCDDDLLPGPAPPEGLVFLADTRTNAGSTTSARTASSTCCGRPTTASSSSSRPATWPRPRRCSTASTATSPATARAWPPSRYLFEAALYVGRLSREVVAGHQAALGSADAPPRSSSAARSPASGPTSSSCTRRATTSGPPTSCRSYRSARRSTASSCSSSPSGPRSTSRRRARSRSARWRPPRGPPLGRPALRRRRLPHGSFDVERGPHRRGLPLPRRARRGLGAPFPRGHPRVATGPT